MTSFIDIDDDIHFDFDCRELTLGLLTSVCDAENCPYDASINLLITHSDNVRVYNKEYRGMDNTTDVLSFPALNIIEGDFGSVEDDVAGNFDPESGELILGDIVINADRVYSQAEEYGHSVMREFAFLLTHSLYHLCGYDHETEEEARIMEKKQEEILALHGITRN